MDITIGDTVTTMVGASSVLIQGKVIDKYDTDAEGRPLSNGPTLVISARDGHGNDHEHVVKLKDVTKL